MEQPNLNIKPNGFAEIHLSSPAVRIRTSQVELLQRVLTRAFYNNAGVTYIFPDPDVRRAALSWFFSSVAIPASRLCGEVYTTLNVDGGVLWIRPGVDVSIRHAVRTEMMSLPFMLDRSSIKRWHHVTGYLETVRRNVAGKMHWYLFALGMDPSRTGKAFPGSLLDPVLAEADWDLRHCYVETFDEKDLPFYRQQGFQINSAGQIPNGGPDFWTLIRPTREIPKVVLW